MWNIVRRKDVHGMRIEQLEYLVEISCRKSFNSASENLFLTPQALSRSISSMENELGFKLFDRDKKGVRFTPEGEKLLTTAQQITELYNRTLKEIHDYQTKMNELYTGNLLIYAHPAFTMSVLPQIINDFCKEYPNINVCLLEDVSSGILDKLEDKSAPIASAYNRIGLVAIAVGDEKIETTFKAHSSYKFVSLRLGKYICCVSKKSNLAVNQSISLNTIVQYPMVRFTNDIGDLSNIQSSVLSTHGNPKIVFKTVSMGAWISAIASNLGIGLIHDIVLSEDSMIRYEFDNVVTLPIKEKTVLESGLLIPNESNPIIDVFVLYIQQYFSTTK